MTSRDTKFRVDSIPSELKELQHWVLWTYEVRDGKSTKVPYQLNGKHAKVNDPKSWTTFYKPLNPLNRLNGTKSGLFSRGAIHSSYAS